MAALEALGTLPVFTEGAFQQIFDWISESVYGGRCPSTIDEFYLTRSLMNRCQDRQRKPMQALLNQATTSLVEAPELEANPTLAVEQAIAQWKKRSALERLKEARSKIEGGGDVDAELTAVTDRITELLISGRRQVSKRELVDDTVEEIDLVRMGMLDAGLDLGVMPPQDGPSKLNRKLLMKPSKLYTIGGLKKTGKTKFLIQSLLRQAERGVPAGLVSAEMSDRQVVRWTLGCMTKINTGRIPSKSLKDDEMQWLRDAGDVLVSMPYEIFYQPGATSKVVRHYARKMRTTYPDGPVVLGVDHLHLMNLERERGESEAGALARTVNEIMLASQTYEISILLISQLTNWAESKKRPTIADLKGSGGIAESSEALMLLHNIDRGKKKQVDTHLSRLTMGVTQRDGEEFDAKLVADLSIGHFYEVTKWSGGDD